jgi:hypothetical protein
MRRLDLAMACVLTIVASSASAESPLPRYDIGALCQSEGNRAAGFATAVYNRCIDREQRAYDALMARKQDVSPEHISLCDAFSIPEVAGYARLDRCLELLSENDAPRKEFRF